MELVENRNGNRSQAVNDAAVVVNDADNVTVKLEPMEIYEIDTDDAVSVASQASTVRFGLFSDERSITTEMETIEDSELGSEIEAPPEPKIYLELLDDKTLTKIFGEFDAIYLKQHPITVNIFS